MSTQPQTEQKTPPRRHPPVVSPALKPVLSMVFLLFSLLAVNSVYLLSVTLLEQGGGEVRQDYFYLLMFLGHLALGLLLILPLLLFGLRHMARAWRRPNRYAVRAGSALFASALLLLGSGVLLTRFGFFEVNDPDVREIAYWLHVLSPLAVAWLFVLHRLAGAPIRWRLGFNWALVSALIAAVLVLTQGQLQREERVSAQQAVNFQPTLARTASGRHIPAENLMREETCAECHPDIAQSWAQSMHRKSSFNNPAYRFSVEETRRVVLKRDGDVEAARLCAGCHDLAPLFSGRFDDPDYDMDGDNAAHAGITCTGCHAIARVNGPRGNSDFTIEDPRHYPFDRSENAFLRAVNRQLIKAKPAHHKQAFLKPDHKTAEFCSTCHKAHLPFSVNHYRWLRGQNHYDSFLQSGVSGHRVDSFYYPPRAVKNCAQCHMPLQLSDDPAARDFDGSGKRSVHNHLFAAANTGVAHLLDLPEWVVEAQQARMSDIARVDIFGLRRDARIDGELLAPLRPKVPVLEAGGHYLLETVVRSVGVGHHLTQGTADSNQLWLEVTVRAGDRVVARSGGMDPSGKVDPWSYFLNAYVLDQAGDRIDRRNGHDIFVALYDHQIPPGAASVVHYGLRVPEGLAGELSVEVALRYRKFDTTYLRHLQGDAFIGNDLPITTLARDSVLFQVGEGAETALDAPAIADWERWNDYGIGLLRAGNKGSSKGALRQAEQAFRKVESLRDGTGALNLARVYFKEGRVDEAARALLRARAGERPPLAWTLAWYSALIDRENGHLDRAISTLNDIVHTHFAEARERDFDFSFDLRVLNLLGRSLYERARMERGSLRKARRDAYLAESRDWYMKTLAIDPEDLSAHHNLALVFAELGDDQQAAHHRAERDRYRPDDHAVEQAVARHRAANPAADHAAEANAIYSLKNLVNPANLAQLGTSPQFP